MVKKLKKKGKEGESKEKKEIEKELVMQKEKTDSNQGVKEEEELGKKEI